MYGTSTGAFMEQDPLVSEKVTLRVGEPDLETKKSTQFEAAGKEGSATDPAPQPMAQSPQRKPDSAPIVRAGVKRSKDELLRILGDPHASEEDWLAASRDIELLGGYKPTARPNHSRRKKIVLTTALLTTLLAALYWCSQIWLTPKPLPPAPVQPAPVVAAKPDYGPYMAGLQRKIKREWFPPKGNTSDRIKVLFTISKNGALSDLRILTPGLSEAASHAALEAVINASKEFSPLPAGSPDSVEIEFTFDYNVFHDK